MATRHAPSVSQYSFSFAPASPLPDSPSTPVEVEADDLADDEDGLPPHSRWGSDGTFGGRPASALRDGGHMTERRGLWRDFDEHDETDGQTGQGREQDERALTSTGSPRSTPTQHHNGSRATDDPTHEHQAHSDPDGIPPASLADGRRRPSTSTAGSSASRRYPPRPPPPTDPIPPLAPDQRTVVSDRTYSSSIASSASGWIVPAPEPERSDERSTLHLSDDGSDDDQLEEQEEAETREGRLRLALEEAEDERQEREWLAWRAGGERQGPQGWNKDKGSKLDRILGETAPLPVSAYSDVLSGHHSPTNTRSSTSTATVKPPGARTRQSGRGHVVRGSIDSGQSYLALGGSDDEADIQSVHSASPFFFADHRAPSTERRSAQFTTQNGSRRDVRHDNFQPDRPRPPRATNAVAAVQDDHHPSRTLSMSSLTPEEKARLVNRAKKLESRLGVTLNGDILAASLTRPPPAARRTSARRASDPEWVPQQFAGGDWVEDATSDGSGLRSRVKAANGAEKTSPFAALGFGGSMMQKSSSSPGPSSYAGVDSHTSALRPTMVQRFSEPTSPSANDFRYPAGLDSPTELSYDQSYMSRATLPRHHLDRLIQHSSSLSLPASLARSHDEFDEVELAGGSGASRRPSLVAESPVSDYGFSQPSPSIGRFDDTRGMTAEEMAVRRLRKMRLSKIHHVLGGEVPQEQLVDGPGTGPWLEPAAHAPRSRTSSNRSDGTDSDGWKNKIGRVKGKVERGASEMKGKVGTIKLDKERKAKTGEGEQTSFLSLEAGDLPEVGGGGTTSKRGLKLNKLFGDAPAPNLYHQDRQNISVSPTSSFFSMRSDTHPSSTSVHRVSGATDFLRN